jgi:hypothetical protein
MAVYLGEVTSAGARELRDRRGGMLQSPPIEEGPREEAIL